MKSLLFIADISGFTNFVNESEAKHGRKVIARLLEAIIDSNCLGMTTSEIEGDAVFFYAESRVPSVEKVVAQAKQMFEAFHRVLRSIHEGKNCRCGACSTMIKLTVKFIAHAGEIELGRIMYLKKPYGSDVIVVHRLLKNDSKEHEYVLLSHALLRAAAFTDSLSSLIPGAAVFNNIATAYPDIGIVPYATVSLRPNLPNTTRLPPV